MTDIWLLPWMALAFGAVGNQTTVSESVDLIEVNHFHDDLGRHVYDQVIFYGWCPSAGEFHVRAWCLLDDDARRPRKTYHDGKYRVTWFDRDHRISRTVIANQYIESWTQVDPERANKKLLDEKYRTALIRGPSRQKQAERQVSGPPQAPLVASDNTGNPVR